MREQEREQELYPEKIDPEQERRRFERKARRKEEKITHKKAKLHALKLRARQKVCLLF